MDCHSAAASFLRKTREIIAVGGLFHPSVGCPRDTFAPIMTFNPTPPYAVVLRMGLAVIRCKAFAVRSSQKTFVQTNVLVW